MRHPARAVDYDTLFRELEARVAAGAVARGRDGDLCLYIYSSRCVYERLWDEWSVLARGLVLDTAARRLLATPFPKFFNYGEGGYALPDEPFEAFEKMDGSLGIAFHDGQAWRVVTKGSFQSTQAKWATARLPTAHLQIGDTYLFELIYPENRIVVRYPWQGLVLLAAYDAEGFEYSRERIVTTGNHLGVRVVPCHAYPSMDEMITACAAMDSQQEGFVVRFASGLRLKMKGEAYRRVHAMLSNTTPLGLWRMIEAQDDLDAMRREIPEEFWDDFDVIRRILTDRLAARIAEVEALHAETSEMSDKDLGMSMETLPQGLRGYLFRVRKIGPTWARDPRTHRSLMLDIRPVGNLLPGYKASTYLMGALDDA